MLTHVQRLTYTIVLCDDLAVMKAFYRELLPFNVTNETENGMAMDAGGVILAVRKRTRSYDGAGPLSAKPGVQLAFRVELDQLEECRQSLMAQNVKILDPINDQPWGHRTLYFADPEGNVLEVFAHIESAGDGDDRSS